MVLSLSSDKGDTLLGTTDSSIIAIDNATEADSGPYTVHVSNQTASDISDVVQVSVVNPVSIVTQPSDVLVMEKSAFELTVDAVGGGEITYAWYLNDQPMQGAISSCIQDH
jgi:hypothetical protein